MTDGMRKFSPVRMTASTQEAAIQQALQIIGATRDEVEVEVLEESAKGVTVRVGPRTAATARAGSSAAESPTVPGQGAQNGESEDALNVGGTDAGATEIETLAGDTTVGDVAEIQASSLEADPALEQSVDVGQDETTPEANVISTPATRPAKPVDPAQQERARVLAQEFLDRMGLDTEVTILPPPPIPSDEPESDTSRVYLQIDGDDVGILIGKHGQTLQSFQYLLNLTLNNRSAEEGVEEEVGLRVVVDAGGYRARRATALEQSAREAAARAKRDRRSIRLEPMPAHERRLVHLALKDDATVTTGSEGREPLRHVVITPAGGARPASGGDRGHGPRRSGGYGDRGGSGGSRGGYGGSGGGGYGGRRGGSGGGSDSRGFGDNRGGGGGGFGQRRSGR